MGKIQAVEKKSIKSEDGLRIVYYLTVVKGSDKSAFLHPAASMNHTSLKAQKDMLNSLGFSTVSIDARGFGLSDVPRKKDYYMLEKYSKDITNIVQAEGLERPLFVCHSVGFMPVAHYVSSSGNASGIIGICSSPCFSESAPNKFMFDLFDKVLRYASDYAGFIISTAGHMIRLEQRPDYPDQSDLAGRGGLVSEFRALLKIADVPLRRLRTYASSGAAILGFDVRAELENIEVPILMIEAGRDLMVRPGSAKKMMEGYKGKLGIITVEGASHSLPMHSPGSVNRIISSYLDKGYQIDPISASSAR